MDTLGARLHMRELARRGLDVLHRYLSGEQSIGQATDAIRLISHDAREYLPDAGYPGELVWQALRRAQVGFDLPLDPPDAGYWREVVEELERAADTLDSLVSPGSNRDIDFHIVS